MKDSAGLVALNAQRFLWNLHQNSRYQCLLSLMIFKAILQGKESKNFPLSVRFFRFHELDQDIRRAIRCHRALI